LLTYVPLATAGPVILGGDDLTDHGSISNGQLQRGWKYIYSAIVNLHAQVTRPGNDGTIAALGSTPSTATSANAGAAIGYAAAAAGLTVSYYNGAPAINQFFADLATGVKNPAILWIAGIDSTNSLDTAEGQALTANAQRIADFVNAGGGLMAHYGGNIGYGWLTTLMPGLANNIGQCDAVNAHLTADGHAAFPTIQDSDINSTAGPCHSSFSGNLGALKVLAVDRVNRFFIIGGGDTIIAGQIVLTPLTATNAVDTTHTVTATVTQATAPFGPLANVADTFNVIGGPNIGKTGTATTNASGIATFTYTGDRGIGTDQIRASFVSGTTTRLSNIVTKEWRPLCDTNNDNVVDLTDITAIFTARGATVSPGDVRDAVVDGVLTVNDGRACVLRCDKPQCADNAQPVAQAGPDQDITLGATVMLDGSASFDSNDDPLTYAWAVAERPEGSTATLSDPTVVQPTFVPDKAGTYTVQLIVNDGAVNSAPDTMQITAIPSLVPVPNLIGLMQADAQAALTAAGLVLGTVTLISSESVPAGEVMSQNPTAGTNAAGGSAVNVAVSSGPPPVTVPDVTGLPQAAAEAELRAVGLTVGGVTQEASLTIPAGYVIHQHLDGGSSIPLGSAVELVVSSGGPPVTVPNVIGQPEASARGAVEAAGLLVGSVTQAGSTTVPAGSILAQNPAGGTSAPSGSAVQLVVSLGALPGGDVSRPLVQLSAVPTTTVVDDTITLTVTASDSEGAPSTTLRINGVIVPVAGNGTATFSSPTPGIFTAVATAVDGAGNVGEARVELRFQVLGDSTQPQVTLTSPTDGAELTQPTAIVGSVSDDGTLVRYLVEASPAGKNEFVVVASGATAVTNGVLGTFDPTLLLNGLYDVRVSVEDASGNVSAVTRTVEVDGQAKVGNFSLSFEDLTIPVAGIPITITRTYDSRNKSTGDFGVGWTLSIKDIELFESTILGRHWEQVQSGGLLTQYSLQPKRPHFVTVRFPDGRLDIFNLVITPSTQTLIPIDFPTASFIPLAGTTSTLVSLDPNNLIVNPSGVTGPVTLLHPDFAVYDPTRYKLTDKEGMVYVINQETGLEKITDLNGNTITFGPNGIIHSAGPSVTFTHDAEGRITQVTDPMGHTLQYAYDFYGDLTAVTDQEGFTTQFRYNPTHGLLDIIDPRGGKVARNEYDDNGRLIAVVDADGQRTELTHDLAARREEIKDRLGHVTVHEYDQRGNVIATADAVGNRSTFTYDGQDNQLTETNPLGHTTTSTYDSRNNLLSRTTPEGRVTTFTYNTGGQVLTRTDGAGHTRSHSYDLRGNVTQATDALGRTIALTYDFAGDPVSLTDAAGRTVHFTYTPAGQVQHQILPDGRMIAYGHDAQGNLTTLIPPSRPAHGFTYTARGQEQGYTPPAPQPPVATPQTTYSYDANGQLTQIMRPDGQLITQAYDNNGNLRTQTLPTGTLSYDYDADGKRTSAAVAGGTVIYTYEPGSTSVTSVTWSGPVSGSVTQTFDAAGRRATQSINGGHTVAFSYDRDNLLTGAGPFSLGRHPQTGVITQTIVENVTDVLDYNAADELTTYQAQGNSTPLLAVQYTRDSLGRISQ
jgi:YD repeat-containing protein